MPWHLDKCLQCNSSRESKKTSRANKGWVFGKVLAGELILFHQVHFSNAAFRQLFVISVTNGTSASSVGPKSEHQSHHNHVSVSAAQKPRYSARNTAMILVRFTTVGRCMFSSVSSSVCQNCGKGVAMTCSTGTPGCVWRRGKRRGKEEDDSNTNFSPFLHSNAALSLERWFANFPPLVVDTEWSTSTLKTTLRLLKRGDGTRHDDDVGVLSRCLIHQSKPTDSS